MSSPWTLYGKGEVYEYTYDPQVPESLTSLGSVLKAWEGTQYSEGSQVRGVGSDCIRALCGVACDTVGFEVSPDHLPADAAMTQPETARQGMRVLLESFGAGRVGDSTLRPMDIVVTKPPGRDTGPGHAMIVGTTKSLWHMSYLTGFTRVGNSLEGHTLVGIYRIKSLWA